MQQTSHPEVEIDLDLLRSGDKAAFTQVVERYADSLYNLTLKLLDNPQEAEDALQETFLNAYKAIEGFEGRSSLNTWLYRIAYNTALMRRRKQRAATVSIDEPLTLDGGQVVSLAAGRGMTDGHHSTGTSALLEVQEFLLQ